MSKRKTFFIFSVVLIIGISTTTLNARATNPGHFDMKYIDTDDDDIDDTLSLYIIHGVTDPDKHYINHIVIQVGDVVDDHDFIITGTTEVDETYTYQETYNINWFEFTFNATRGNAPDTGDAPIGDAILVTVTCNLEGIFQKFLKLYPTPGGHEYGFNSVIVPVLIATIIVATLLLLPKLLIKDKKVLVTK